MYYTNKETFVLSADGCMDTERGGLESILAGNDEGAKGCAAAPDGTRLPVSDYSYAELHQAAPQLTPVSQAIELARTCQGKIAITVHDQTMLRQLVDDMEEQGVEDCFLIQLGPDLTDLTRHQEIMDAQLQICEKNEDIVLVSTLPAELTGADMKDEGGIHFTQKALNLIGEDAGKNAREYVKEHGAEKESQ